QNKTQQSFNVHHILLKFHHLSTKSLHNYNKQLLNSINKNYKNLFQNYLAPSLSANFVLQLKHN
ncbi:hypothetical protein, partial [Bacillus sp. WP8]|uniref:hypothetical protein n=1 Tax=Bacillus sp. WP8 TaxID=756828 RepID=UPI001C92FE97